MKSRTKPALRVVPATPVQLSLNVEGVLRDVRHAFYGLCVAAGKQVLAAMMEADRHELCGAHNVPDAKRRAVRGGTTRSAVVLGGQRIAIARPRARSLEHGELKLPAFAWAAQADPLDAATMASMAAGVSTRRYVRTLDPLPAPEEPRSVSKSAVSRRWVALSQAQLHEWLSCSLKELDLPVVMIDGIHFRERVILVALGIDAQGDKHVLGLREGSTESTRVVRSLLSDLIDRGLDADRARLWVIDGGKALRRAIVDCFGQRALVQRCQEHKRRNVVEHLPQELHAGVGRAMRAAWDSGNAVLAKKQLQRLASSLEARHPGATASLREGMDETLTAQTLGISGALYRTLRTTNPIENLNGSIAHFTRNVKRWKDGQMTLRWIAGALSDAKGRFRKLRGHRDMKLLLAELTTRVENADAAGLKAA
jgi:transposase-like protein